MEILTFFCFRLNQIQNCSAQIKKMKHGIFSFQLKKNITSAERLPTMVDLKMYPLPLIWLESQSHTMKGMIEENSRENRSDRYHVR